MKTETGLSDRMKKLYTLEKLESLSTLSSSHFNDLKVDTGYIRIWLSRLSFEDGITHKVTVERLVQGNWIVVDWF